MKESQLLKADSASNSNKGLSQRHNKIGEKDESIENDACSSLNGENSSSNKEDESSSSSSQPKKNLVMQQLKQLESVNDTGKDQRGLNGCKGPRIRSKSTDGVVGTLTKTFEDSNKNKNGNNYNVNNKCNSTTTATTSSKFNEQNKLQQPSVNNKAKPVPPAKPPSLVRFPVSPAGTLGRVRRSDAF